MIIFSQSNKIIFKIHKKRHDWPLTTARSAYRIPYIISPVTQLNERTTSFCFGNLILQRNRNKKQYLQNVKNTPSKMDKKDAIGENEEYDQEGGT